MTDKGLETHVLGTTRFLDDLDKPHNQVGGFVFPSPVAHGIIREIDFTEALQCPGVHAILSAKDIPGVNSMGPAAEDEPVLATSKVEYAGQAVLLVAADNRACAKKAMEKVKIRIEALPPVLDPEVAFKNRDFLFNPLHIERGEINSGFDLADHLLEGKLEIGGQEHFYLETQGSLATPLPDGSLHIASGTQDPTANQHAVAKALNIEASKVEVTVHVIGGGFGGKETQSTWCAVWSALLATACQRPVRMVLDRREDMVFTGKRHPAVAYYKVGYTGEGVLTAYSSRFLFDCGYCSDLSYAILERCMLHLDNAYYLPAIQSDIYPCKTNKASNTALRGFGAPQAIAVIEHIMEEVAAALDLDPALVRQRNFYAPGSRNVTPYGQVVKDNVLKAVWQQLLTSADYEKRKAAAADFNKRNKFTKRGLALVPVKFGISYTTTFLNQGAALVNLYKDGSLTVHQGGVEMGQGLYDKMKTVAGREFGLKKEAIRIYPVNTMIIPNTSATAASTGSDLNGHAIKRALDRLKKRLNGFISTTYNIPLSSIVWEDSLIYDKNKPDIKHPLKDLVQKAHAAQISLSEQAFYKTPGIYFDKTTATGKPFYYFVTGMALTEVEANMLTGDYRLLRTDILHDVGDSLDWAIDKGQIAGAFVQGMGWVTLEELIHDNRGNLLTSGPDTYKIPGIADIPEDFRIHPFPGNPFKGGILGSRAIGEPPLMYGLSVWLAIKNALSAYAGRAVILHIPATKERIVMYASAYGKMV
ncbi:MAG: xanthine dehydrogenase molybdopterin binding subunit [Bacteroidales bacterium]|nr:xanthine dehydrogenase molybdopterin binding subunit [Bacteroidales bacterium]